MNKKILVSLVVLLTLVTTCNVYKVWTQTPLVDFFFGRLEALADGECGPYEFKGKLLDQVEMFCGYHQDWHQHMDCIDVNDDEKCCDSRLQTTKPDCNKNK